MKNILITGGAGFIGSRLSLKLIEEGHVITVLDNLSVQIHGITPRNSPLFKSIAGKVKFIEGDVRSKEDWQNALHGQDIVVHFAAETGTGQSMYQIEKYVDVNVKGTSILLDLLANGDYSIEKVLVASSRAIYGEGKYFCPVHADVYPEDRTDQTLSKAKFDPECPSCDANLTLLATDEKSKIHPSSIYGITKHNQEQMVLVSCKSIGVPAVALRYQNVYGPGQSLSNPYTGILSIFSTRILNDNPINIFEDGEESRDFVFIDDVVEATKLAMFSKQADTHVFNVGSGVATTVSEVAYALQKHYSSNVDISVSGNYRLGDIRHNKADISKVQKVLGFEPKVMFEEGIRLFSTWVLNQELQEDNYNKSIQQLKDKGLMK
jgi:dTDP-L-rhamnose 4-epimerase